MEQFRGDFNMEKNNNNSAENVGFTGIYTEKQRNKKMRAEYDRLSNIFANIQPELLQTVDKLLHEAAFLAVVLEETRLIIARDGIVEVYQNGENQCGRKKSVAVETYDKSLNTYLKICKQLCDYLPDDDSVNPAEEIMNFINSGD